MHVLNYVTGNQSKFLTARDNLQKNGIELEQKELDIPKIQTTSTGQVALDKAARAFELVKQPLLVSDHGWSISTLNGFPGPYMKYMNTWLEPNDFLALMQIQQNREVTLRQNLIYIDQDTTKSFTHDLKGYLLQEAKGSLGTNWDKVVCLTHDDKSIAEAREASGKGSILLDEPEPLTYNQLGRL